MWKWDNLAGIFTSCGKFIFGEEWFYENVWVCWIWVYKGLNGIAEIYLCSWRVDKTILQRNPLKLINVFLFIKTIKYTKA